MKNKLNDVIDPKIKFEVVESSDVDGEYIVAKVRGQFFVPDGNSRNGRHYKRKVWENVLSDPKVMERLENRNMFGTVGHGTKINDEAVQNGLISHIVTSLGINENNEGIGEALILNTPAGRSLNTIMRAGGKMFVSTRANGSFKGKHEGMPCVDPETFDFETVDFVCEPGFLEANPSIAESLNTIMDDHEKEGNFMSAELVKLLTEQKDQAESKVEKLTTEVSTLTDDKAVLVQENTHLKGEAEKLELANTKLAEYAEHGSVEEIKESLESLKEANETVEAVKELGTVEEIKESLAELNTITEELGSKESIEEALKTAIDYKTEVSELGSVEELKESLEVLESIKGENEKKELEETKKTLVEELKMSEEQISKLLEKFTADEIRDLYKVEETNEDDTNEDDSNEDEDISETFKKKNEDNDDDTTDGEEVYESKILSKSFAERING